MKDLFVDIKKAVASGVSEAIVFLSTGKDSLATLTHKVDSPRGWDSKIVQADIENYLRRKYEISFTAQGYRAGESLQRRGMMSKQGTVDQQYKRLFPIGYWSQKD